MIYKEMKKQTMGVTVLPNVVYAEQNSIFVKWLLNISSDWIFKENDDIIYGDKLTTL